MTDQVNDGLFFTQPPDLPRGRHPMGREEVKQAQRERLMIAATELVAGLGYRHVGVREIAARARVSRAAFYECFSDKDDCVFAAYDRFITVVVDRLIGSVAGHPTWDQTVSAVVAAYLGTLESDVVVARAFQVEMDALGRPARQRRRDALMALAQMLKARRDHAWPGDEDVPLQAYAAAVYALRQTASDALDAGGRPDLLDLGEQLQPAMSALLSARAA